MEKAPKLVTDSRRTPADILRFTDLHFSNLHDQDEDGAGEKVDLGTGKVINNSTDTGMGGLRITKEVPVEADDRDDDEAALWIKAEEERLRESGSSN